MTHKAMAAISRTKSLVLNQSGQVVVLVALLSTALASTLVLAVDFGIAYQGRRQMQTSVDAAALAGAVDIAEGGSQEIARATVAEYVARNLDEPIGSVEISFPDSERVTVDAKIDRQTFFARLFGKQTMRVGAQATASMGLAGSVNNLVPIIVPESSIEGHIGPSNSAVFELGEDRPTGQDNQGETTSAGSPQMGYFWLADFDSVSNGTSDYRDWIINGYPGLVEVGSVANGTGVRGALESALAERMNIDPAVVLPLFDYTEGGGHIGSYHVTGFAEFVITGFELNGNPKTISGHFTQGTVTTGAGADQSLPDYGVKVIWLSD